MTTTDNDSKITEADFSAIEARVLLHRVADLERALRFYADPTRYNGPNQHIKGDPDEYQPKDAAYLLDVTRDGGKIARDALDGHFMANPGDVDPAAGRRWSGRTTYGGKLTDDAAQRRTALEWEADALKQGK
ncbi:hypothetical protein [Bradyrhizobium sp. 153]|uniref:hypothetical protein n=1 Tax=Bradyrhizobium sp. 153 TaxID=2782627 RepID=UPI001FFC170B|nr:hypothetical protein [Bradyrhizobium sp. 153]MCK1668681.1 hypothetical protein [Bradyrhizobium sp. 153]